MRRSLTLIGVLIGCLLLSGSLVGMSHAETASVPQFLGDSAFLQSTPDAHVDATNDIEERWRFATGSQIDVPPLVIEGVVYSKSNNGNLYALDAATGKERWRFTTKPVFSTSPVVVAGVVYIGSFDRNVYALNAAMGTERWRFTTGYLISPSPVVADGVVHVWQADGILFALDAAMGMERWRFKSSTYPSVVAVDDVVYVGDNRKYIYALNAVTGTTQWRFEAGDSVDTSPVVVDDIVYVGSFDGCVYALDAETGTEQWRFRLGSRASASVTVVDDIVYIGAADDNVYALGARPLTLEAGGQAVVTGDGTVLRGAPAVSGVERATLTRATAVTLTGDAVQTGNLAWWPVTVDDTGELGWISADDLEPTANRPRATPSALHMR